MAKMSDLVWVSRTSTTNPTYTSDTTSGTDTWRLTRLITGGYSIYVVPYAEPYTDAPIIPYDVGDPFNPYEPRPPQPLVPNPWVPEEGDDDNEDNGHNGDNTIPLRRLTEVERLRVREGAKKEADKLFDQMREREREIERQKHQDSIDADGNIVGGRAKILRDSMKPRDELERGARSLTNCKQVTLPLGVSR